MAHITIPAGEPLVSYTPGGSSTGPFNVTFPIFSTDDLNVMVNGSLLSSSDWVFTPTDTRTGGYQAGYITLDSATTYEVVIYRDTTRSRTSDYASGPLDINTLNTDVDRTVARDQDLRMLIDRALRGPASDPAMDALPDAATRANQYLIFDADGQPTLAAYGVTTTPVSSFMATVLDDTTAADARTTLGVTLTNLGVSAFAQTILDDADAATARATLGVTLASDAEYIAKSATNRVLTPANLAAKPCFDANKNGTDQTSVADATFTKVTFTTESFDVGSYYDAANSKWTPPAGKVLISATLVVAGTFASTNPVGACFISIYKNGAEFKRGVHNYTFNSTAAGAMVVAEDKANGTDYYEIYVYSDVSSGTSTVVGTAARSYFSGVCL